VVFFDEMRKRIRMYEHALADPGGGPNDGTTRPGRRFPKYVVLRTSIAGAESIRKQTCMGFTSMNESQLREELRSSSRTEEGVSPDFSTVGRVIVFRRCQGELIDSWPRVVVMDRLKAKASSQLERRPRMPVKSFEPIYGARPDAAAVSGTSKIPLAERSSGPIHGKAPILVTEGTR